MERKKMRVLYICLLSIVLHVQQRLMPILCQGSNYTDACTSKESESYIFCNKTLSIETRVADLISRLSLEEKINRLVDGAAELSNLSIPAYEWWGEALHGVASSPAVRWDGAVEGATSFPMPISLAASFNKSLWNQIGQVISTEARAMHNLRQSGLTFWSPVINILRDPRWGRAQETPGEDPYLVGQYAVYFVRGMQEENDYNPSGEGYQNHNEVSALKTSACCKHFTAYDLDNWQGIDRYSFNAEVTNQDLADTYNPPFQSCVQEGRASCLMCSYNRLNGVPTCADADLLKGLVKSRWGFQGYIVTDCDSLLVMYTQSNYSENPAKAIASAILAGLDLNCGTTIRDHAATAVRLGLVTEDDIDTALANTGRVLMRLGLFDGNRLNQPYGELGAQNVCDEKHRNLATEAAVQGIVLLKNDNRSLPFSPSSIKTLAVIGPNADDKKFTMLGNYEGQPCEYVTPLEGLSLFGIDNVVLKPGCANTACDSEDMDNLIEDAVNTVAKADAVVLVMGLDQDREKETLDRDSLLLPGNQERLIKAVASAAEGSVVLVIMCGGPVDISFAKYNSKIQSIIWMGYSGQAGGRALAQVIFGERNPGGRLPVTWYTEAVTKWPMTNMNMRPDPSTGYPGRSHRFYTGATVYDFGYGLTYTDFTIAKMIAPSNFQAPSFHQQICYHKQMALKALDECSQTDADFCAEATFPLTISLKNDGTRAADEVLLLYHAAPGAGDNGTQIKELIAFERHGIPPRTSNRIELTINVCKHMSTVKSDGTRSLDIGTHKFILRTGSESLHEIELR